MRLLVSPDRFSGALSALQVAAAVRRGWLRQAPDTELRELPMSDGDAGLLDAVHAARGGRLVSVTATGPLGEPVPATILHVPGTAGGTVYVEAGQVVGCQLTAPGQALEHAERGSSAGLGELLAAALQLGPSRVVVGLGRSATHDGGAGMVRALAGIGNVDGEESAGDDPGLDARTLQAAHAALDGVDLVVAVAEQSPLLGLHGAGAQLAEREGIGPGEAQRIDTRIGELVAQVEALRGELPGERTSLLTASDHGHGAHGHGATSPRPGRADGSGAGGGAAHLLTVLGARVLPGPQVVADAVGLDDAVAQADVVLTGAAVLDAPAVDASVIATVGQAAMRLGLPVVVLAEEVHTSRREVARSGISATYATGTGLDALESWAARVARTWARTT